MNRRTIFNILIISILIFLFSFKRDFSIENLGTPPGTVKMGRNFYIDRAEVRTIDYCEFLHWTKKVFGNNSKEYISVLPDTTVWNLLGNKYQKLSQKYLRGPSFRRYPVVGISFLQAQKFTKWRSDRVMEFILIRDGIFNYNPLPIKDSFFTIERYCAGKYGKISLLIEHQYYPEYSLPDSVTYLRSLVFADSLNSYTLLHSKEKEKLRKITTPFFKEISLQSLNSIPVRPQQENFYHKGMFKTKYNYDIIIDLKGNVEELTSKEGITFGGSYRDQSIVEVNELFKKNNSPNCYTGFRNICRYKKLVIK